MEKACQCSIGYKLNLCGINLRAMTQTVAGSISTGRQKTASKMMEGSKE